MNQNPMLPRQFSELPALLPFLPMLYVAWADAVLTPSEINLIRTKIEAQGWLNEPTKAILKKWLDPANPPSPRELKEWLNIIKESAPNIQPHAKQTLANFGIDIARLNGFQEEVSACSDSKANLALCQIEEALGVVSQEAFDEMMSATDPQHSPTNVSTIKEPSAPFNVELLQQILDGDYHSLRMKARKILNDPAFALTVEQDKEAFREQTLVWSKLLADQGWGALAYPKKYGGQDDIEQYFAVFETMGYHDLSLAIKFGVQFGLWGGSVQWLGTKFHHKWLSKKIGTLEIPGCFAMTENGHGSNVREIETTATYDAANQEFVIHTATPDAFKTYIGNAAVHGEMATVFAQLETNGERYGVHAFVVPIRDKNGKVLEGIRIEDNGLKLGLNGVDNGKIWFDHVRVPRQNLLNRFGDVAEDGTYSSPIASESKRFFTMLGTLVGGRIGVPKTALSATKTALTIAIKYALKRRQFGAANEAETLLLDYRSHQRRLLPYLANAYAYTFALQYLTKRFVNRSEDDAREIEALAAGFKAVVTWNTTATIQECREACGGQGYMAENRFAALKSDSDIFTTFEGDNTVLLQLVAKGRLSEFKQQFHDMNWFTLVKFFTSNAIADYLGFSPLTTRNTDSKHLRSSKFHLQAFRFREEDLVRSVAQRLKRRIDSGMNSYDAFIECQTHLITMAKAYIDRVVLEQFIEKVYACKDEPTREALKQVCKLYALQTIEKHSAWYQEQGYIESGKSKAIRREVDALCLQVRDNALDLVAAFGVPEQSLGELVD
ncbi:MAG: acyl-CoA dehydrogenase [Chitinophagales bacterium]